MSSTETSGFRSDEPWYGARSRVMRGFIIGTVGYVLIVVVILGTMYVLAKKVATATADYEAIKAASAELQTQYETVLKQKDAAARQVADSQARIADLQAQHATLLAQKQAADATIAESQAKVAELQRKLDQIYDFAPHIVPLDEVDEKMAYGAIGEPGFQIFSRAIRDSNRKLAFTSADDPNVGFTSPGYAQYLLRMIAPDRSLSNLKPRKGAPKNGDIISYQPAYYMFYFSIPGKEFVIGMTPEGVLALDPDFGTRMGVFVGVQP